MLARRQRHGLVPIVLAALVTTIIPAGAWAQGTDELGVLREEVSKLHKQSKYAEALPLADRYVALARQKHGEQHAEFATAIDSLAHIYYEQGRYDEAEPLVRQGLAIREKALGPDHPDVGESLNNVAVLYFKQGRYADAVALYTRALTVREKALGPDHPDVGQTLTNLARLYRGQEAEPLLRRALAIREKTLGPDHPDVAHSLRNLARVYKDQGRHAEAESTYQRTLAIREKALGPDHSDVAESLADLAFLHMQLKRYAEAEALSKRALATYEKALGPDHPEAAHLLDYLAAQYQAQSDWSRAADFWRLSTRLTVRRAQRGTDEVGQAVTGKKVGEAERASYRFRSLIKVAHRLLEQDRGAEPALAREMFQAAQWAETSEAGQALAQMAARGARGDRELAHLIRKRQDLVGEWQSKDKLLIAARFEPPTRRDAQAETVLSDRLAGIDVQIAEIDSRLKAEFPDYAAFARPAPLTVEEVQAQLSSDEALVLFLDNPGWGLMSEETFVWIVTKGELRWVRSPLGTVLLFREVWALRCGLDAAAWDGKGAATCAALLSIPPEKAPGADDPLPFDHARAHALYKALLGEADDLIKSKHLLLVASGALSQLPFQVLVTSPVATPDPSAKGVAEPAPQSAGADHRHAAWLARSHAITILPAVASLQALRRVGRPSAATRTMIGFGNPLLDGDQSHLQWGEYYKEQAALARQKQACPQTPWQHIAALFRPHRAIAPMAMRQGRPDLAHLRVQSPLHDTADELCAVAKDLKVLPDDIVLGAKATEAAIKRLNSEDRLAQYRVVHFATHGTLAGEISGTSEPGLVFTPPAEQTEADDGFLSASEVAALKLDADWVILSACNTAAGGAKGAEALSGLARAFIYAGARALLVSHWAVDSAATVKLVTSAVGTVTRDAKLGRAEALRRAMLEMIDKGEPKQAHPAYWAPFVVVGEGAGAEVRR